MIQTFPFETSREHYEADACIVWCFDDRFTPLCEAFIKERGFLHVDRVVTAGGAKALASELGPDRDFILNQVKLSINLHAASRVILMLHIDCGGYGGSARFKDHEDELRHHNAELIRAAKTIAREFPKATVEAYIADFDGLHLLP